MHNDAKEILVPGLMLLLITVIAGGLLGYVFMITKIPIEERLAATKAEAMTSVLPEAEEFEDILKLEDTEKTDIIKSSARGIKSGETVGYVVAVSTRGYSGNVDVLVGINTDGKIEAINIVNHSETPGLGSNATKPKFTDQYKGKSGTLKVTKMAPKENEIEAMTSSTITTSAVTLGANEALIYFEKNLKQ